MNLRLVLVLLALVAMTTSKTIKNDIHKKIYHDVVRQRPIT